MLSLITADFFPHEYLGYFNADRFFIVSYNLFLNNINREIIHVNEISFIK